jgi:ankyrin
MYNRNYMIGCVVRFWLIDCANVSSDDVTRFADVLFHALIQVPFVTKFVLFSRRYSPTKAQLRLFCVTNDKVEKSLEKHESFSEVARSDNIEVALQYLKVFFKR